MKTLERLLVLWIFIAAIGACLNACGEGTPTNVCNRPLDITVCTADGVLGYLTSSGCYVDPNPDCRPRLIGGAQ